MHRMVLGPSRTCNVGAVRSAVTQNETFELPISDCTNPNISQSATYEMNLDNLLPLSSLASSFNENENVPFNQIQTGVIEFSSHRNCAPIQETQEFQIAFSTPFDDQPQVGILFTDIESSNKEATRVYSEVTVITKRFFKVKLGTSPNSGSEIFKMKLSWIATTHPDLQIMQVKLGSYPKDPIQKFISMRLNYHHRLSQPPKIVAALNTLDIDRHNNRCINISLSEVGIDGFSFNIHVWNKSKFWKVGYTFVIIANETIATTRWVPHVMSNPAETSMQQGIMFSFKNPSEIVGFPSATYSFHNLQLPFLAWCKFDLNNTNNNTVSTYFNSPTGMPTDNGNNNNGLLDLLPLSQYYPVVIPVLQGFDTCKHHFNGIEIIAQFSLCPATEMEIMQHVLWQQAQTRMRNSNKLGAYSTVDGVTHVENAFASDSFMGSSSSFISSLSSGSTNIVTARSDLEEYNFLHVFAHATQDCKAFAIQVQVLVLNRNMITGRVQENIIVLSDR